MAAVFTLCNWLGTCDATDLKPDAGYERVCLQPLPPNTSLDKQVQIDPCTIDFYYSQQALSGASKGNRKWVCRRAVTDAPNGCTPDPGQAVLDPVETINYDDYNAQAGALANAVSNNKGTGLCDGATGVLGWICGSPGSGFSISTWLILGFVGLVAFILVLTFLLPDSAVRLARAA